MVVPEVLQQLNGISVLIGVLLVAWQLRQANRHRHLENVVASIERTAEHNWHIIEDEERRVEIEKTEKLFALGRTPDEKRAYWAARAVHLSHINLLWQVWELAGRPNALRATHDGWNRFAGLVAKKLVSATAPPAGTPSDWAAFDLWQGLHRYEVHPQAFVEWLARRAQST